MPSFANMVRAYLLPASIPFPVLYSTVRVAELPESIASGMSVSVTRLPLIFSIVTVASLVPELIRDMTVVLALGVNTTFVTVISVVSMNPMVSDPIHAATAMETATVTAMSMMAATTGLRAFLLFRSFFIFGYFPPCEFTRELDSKEI